MTAEEKQIQQLMKSLDLTREEAIELMEEDKKIDKMTKASDIESDLTEEQKEGIKQNTKDHSGKYEKSEETKAKEQKAREDKATAMNILMNAVEGAEVTKVGKEFIFFKDNVKYRVTIVKARK